MINLKDDEFDVATTTNMEEAKRIPATGFNHVTETDWTMPFRSPNKFNVQKKRYGLDKERSA